MILKTSVLAEGFLFPEGPRWQEGKLWVSDMQSRWVTTVDLQGKTEKIVEVPGSPSGLGWLPDGRLLVVSMIDRRLLRLDPEGLAEAADLSRLASFHCNDMVVDRQGRAYIGNFGFDFAAGEPASPAEIILVFPDGRARVVSDGLLFPNGTVITPDGGTLIVAETFGHRLTAFAVQPDGSLADRRVWADLEGVFPDGICLDAEGAVWVAAPEPGQVLRVAAGGTITHRVQVSTRPYACMLGSPERRTLFVCTAESSVPGRGRRGIGGRIETVEVEVPGAGLP
ncbi:MAG: SMP-30/gluconolactonase/LRE family protein [Deltaproteobacteria bacterium]|nr:SMP-30/gluconolactonase/LRE family protein [Deltaproteobacteria bacterium]